MTERGEFPPQKLPPYRLLLGILLVLGLVLRIGAALWWEMRLGDDQRFFFGDSLSYEVLARQLAQGADFAYGTAYVARTPGYPLLLTPLYWFFEEPPTLALRMVGVLCGTAAIALAAWIARLLFGHMAGLIAAVLVAFYPGAIAMSVFILSEAPFAPLMLATLGLAIVALREDGWRRLAFAATAGAVFGMAILVRPSWLMFPLFAAPVGLLFYGQRKQQLAVYAVAGLAAATVMTPWWVRNYVVVGKFVPTSLQVGASLYDGLGPQATGASDMEFVDQFKKRLAAEEAASGEEDLPGTYESRLDEVMKRESLEWARQNPERVLRLAGVKFWRYWTPLGNSQEVRGKMAWVIAVGYLPIVLTGLVGAVAFARRGWVYLLLALPLIYFCLLHLVFVSSIRYRQPPMLALTILSAGLLAMWWQNVREPAEGAPTRPHEAG